jgi:vancomycin resistance protein VanW
MGNRFMLSSLVPRRWRRTLRIAQKQTTDLLRGRTLALASQQSGAEPAHYPFLWGESITPIPDRGTAEIRANRLSNLQLASGRFDLLRWNPHQILSFCHRVGDPSFRNGFQPGPVFVGGQVLTGSGGGLCLLATNLFHLILHTGGEILERHCHSIDAYGEQRFYELGQDASIAYGYKDLIVRNASTIPLLLRLRVEAEQGHVISSLWGQARQPWRTRVNSQILEELPSSDPEGTRGWIVATQRFLRDSATVAESRPRAAELCRWRQDYQSISVYQPMLIPR